MHRSYRFVCALTALIALALLSYFSARADGVVNQSIPDPDTWVMFTSDSGAKPATEMSFVNKAPKVIVYVDGTIVWGDPAKLWIGSSEDPSAWHIGKLAKDDLDQLLRSSKLAGAAADDLDRAPLPTPGTSMTTHTIAPAGITIEVGIRTGGHELLMCARTETSDTGTQSGTDDFSKAVASLRDKLMALKPTDSVVFVPQAITVAAFVIPEPNAICSVGKWPLPEAAQVEPGDIGRNYSGPDAIAIIKAVSFNAYMQFGNKLYHVVWTPAIAIPGSHQTVTDSPLPPLSF